MTIGILTYYRSENFGANLQGLSTYRFLERAGHSPIMIQYASKEYSDKLARRSESVPQAKAHLEFVDANFPRQTELCHNAEDINREIKRCDIEAIIMGSDAIVQHHPLLSRIHRGNRKPIYIDKPTPERMFPNMFWGIGIDSSVSLAYMSVSSQNSQFKYFTSKLKRRMAEALKRYGYISVRDRWTQRMFEAVNGIEYPYTPDPVFAFNHNVPELLADKDAILKKFGLPEKYVLVSLMNQSVDEKTLSELASAFREKGLECVSLPMPTGSGFKHDFRYSIPEPLDPADWYNLIRHASGYVGSNMHPIIVSLANGVPCYSLDFWGAKDFWNRPKNDGSSKVQDILNYFGLSENHHSLNNNMPISVNKIVDCILGFPVEDVKSTAAQRLGQYNEMMDNILNSLS